MQLDLLNNMIMRYNFRYIFFLLLSLFVSEVMAQTNVWRDIYEVKKKDTIFGIAKKYEISVEELMNANPEMKASDYKLKKGTTVFIPKKKDVVKEIKAYSLMKTLPGKTVRIGVMLPLHDVDGDGKRMVEYYRGILVACDSLRHAGINTDIYAWNVDINADIRIPLLENKAKDLDIIFGPLYTKQVKHVADFCRQNEIKLVIPFSISANDVNTNPYVYQVYQSDSRLNDRAIGAFMGRFMNYNVVIIDCNDTTSDKGIFTFGLRKQLEAKGIGYQVTNLNSSLQNFAKVFAANKKNVVILNTGRSPELNLAFRKLNELTAVAKLEISMFGYNEWLQYEPTYRELYHKYDVYVPSTYYYYKGLTRIAQFEQNYKKWFGVDMQNIYIPRFAITGFDHAQFFIRGLWEKGSAFGGTKGESKYYPMQSQLQFIKKSNDGGMQNNAFQLVHYNINNVIETLSY